MATATKEKPAAKPAAMTPAPPKKSAIDPAEYKRPTNAQGLQRLADPLLPQIKAAMPAALATHAERMIRALLTECQKTPGLLDCSPASLLGGVIQVAQLGLELGGPAGQAYLIPFKGSAALVIGYKGYIALAYRSNKVRRITPRVVREGDTIEVVYGSDQKLLHRPAMPPTGKPVAYYAVIELDNGGTDFEYLTVEQCDAHRAKHALMKSGGPWIAHFDEMAMKTCIRRLAKRMPVSAEWVAAAGLDEMAEAGVPQSLSAAVVIESAGEPGGGDADPADRLRARLDHATAPAHDPGDPEQDPFPPGHATGGRLFAAGEAAADMDPIKR